MASPAGPRDTIAAIATPPGRGAVGVVRVSGPASVQVATAILGACPPPRTAAYRPFLDNDSQPLDHGIAIYFPGPASFTGEDVLELQAHGSPVLLNQILARTLHLGARAARPGEFSLRAYLNGKIDLLQAEALADLIASATAEEARSAVRSLSGEFSQRVHQVAERLTTLRARIEADLDFPVEDVPALSPAADLAAELADLISSLDATTRCSRQGSLLRQGLTVAIVGRPNVGKSSLLNALAGRPTAIVTPFPGTTRDVLREPIAIDGIPLHLFDTAGLRDTNDPIEALGVQRAWDAIRSADALLFVIDASAGWGPAEDALAERLPRGPARIHVHNKIDLTGHPTALLLGPHGPSVYLSAATGEGLGLLRQALRSVGGDAPAEPPWMARPRHLEALAEVTRAVQAARQALLGFRAPELIAEELRLAHRALGLITGECTTDDLLDRIFSEFCIGK
jgi:tRNA modification GTPase